MLLRLIVNSNGRGFAGGATSQTRPLAKPSDMRYGAALTRALPIGRATIVSCMTFTHLPTSLAEALTARGYTALTPVQAAVTEDAAKGRDLLVSAQTGSVSASTPSRSRSKTSMDAKPAPCSTSTSASNP